MNNRRRGIALVINNIEFKDNKHTKREGAEFDSENLERVLRKLHFKILLHHNKTQCEMRKHLERLASQNHSDADSFMCVIMSHGTKLQDGSLGVFGVDGETINIEAEAKLLFSNQNCPSLKDKSKLFFVDACWGESNMGVSNNNTIQPKNSSDVLHICDIYNNSYRSETTNNLVISDFLFSFSTVPNYVSLRDRKKGNWFIQEFASALGEFGETRTLIDIMHTVRQKLMRKGTTDHAQMSVDHWMLSRHVLFKCKLKKNFVFVKYKHIFTRRKHCRKRFRKYHRIKRI